ncbi:fatty acid desaturase [Rhizobium sp. CF122]|uniref:fatty acid desaturase n=1 Tax=Rhizobium sp. CF122 TaxID=1144312 RepID=UPI00027185FF|nr:fatty acid desaturase [Rhizobium sp. CF122]EJL58066.1 fatty acid desaturase [Rhizobium sp. CF122]
MKEEKFDDFSANFAVLRREVWDMRYKELLQSLKPDYAKVRRDIVFGYTMLAGTIVLVGALPLLGVPALLLGFLGALSIGYWVAYLQLFIHEGAHYNLAPDRAESDRLCDQYISWMIGTTVSAYRKVHFEHHRALGSVDDSESTYFFPLNLVFFARALFGLRVIEVLLARKGIVEKKTKTKEKLSLAPLVAIAVHGGFIAISFLLGLWWLSLGWLIGVGMMFPFFGALRQLLEHRDESAGKMNDYRVVPHGAVTRMFEDGPFGSTFGGAGFNRHLLHHWEPQVSYTNLAELERFLLTTKAGPIIERRKTTYAQTFLKLLSI